MHVRVVRFTDVDPDRVEKLVSEIDESGGPPPGIKTTGLPGQPAPAPATTGSTGQKTAPSGRKTTASGDVVGDICLLPDVARFSH